MYGSPIDDEHNARHVIEAIEANAAAEAVGIELEDLPRHTSPLPHDSAIGRTTTPPTGWTRQRGGK
jgi:hypothetical protein